MKNFDRIMAGVIALITVLFILTGIYIANVCSPDGSRPYRVEVNRVSFEIEKEGYNDLDLSKYVYVTDVKKYTGSDNSFYDAGSDYYIKEINGEVYRIDYTAGTQKAVIKIKAAVYAAFIIMTIVIISVLLFIRHWILKPFDNLTDVPYELSKGNLTVPLRENKTRFFGRFVWGVNMLREKMEKQKLSQLQMQKDKKTLLLSISHDIKTPLSAIKLYSKSLSRGLYTDKQKQKEVAESINAKADEIEEFITQLIKATGEDFLDLEIKNGEFYLSELMGNIEKYYTGKLADICTDFEVMPYNDGLISGDPDRSIEVLQNIMENAIKYGDGSYIKIFFSEEENCRLVTIENSGCTLHDNEILHIFDSFWRGSNSHSKSGSGLGLYICRQLMSGMHGDIFACADNGIMKITVVFPMV